MSETVLGRPHAERLLYDLNEIRTQLIETVKELGPEAFDLAPRSGLKTCKFLLQEIGTMEVLSRHLASHGVALDWNENWQALDKSTPQEMLAALAAVRAETVAYLDRVTEETIETPIPLPQEWQQYFGGATVLEPEELLRWVVRHEYYHLGQLNTYSFMRATCEEAKA